MQTYTWTGLADPNTLALNTLGTMVLFDLRAERLLSHSLSPIPETSVNESFWQLPTPGRPGTFMVAIGPFLLRDGWFYSSRPFERRSLADGTREQFPPLRTDYAFEPQESFQLLPDGKRVLAADQFSLWLLELNPEPARAPVGNGNQILTPPKPSPPASSLVP
jgi:hypothetical protein